MISRNILTLLNKYKNKYFSLQNIVNYTGAGKGVVKVTLSRLVARKKIFGLGFGYYAASLPAVDVEQLACQLYYPAYISFEYALYLHGLYSQVPAVVTLATAKRPKTITLAGKTVEYSHLKKNLFFGYKMSNNTLLATPEKALLDELYLIGMGKRRINLEELDLSKIKKTKIKQLSKYYPAATRRKLAGLL